MSTFGRNELCRCGSGKKYKKCCMDKDNEPIPREVINYFLRKRAEAEMLQRAGILIPMVNPVHFAGGKIWAFGKRVYKSPNLNETFHEFLIGVLKQTLGHEWLSQQQALPESQKHFIVTCLNKAAEWMIRNANESNRIAPGKPMMAIPDGYMKSLLVLAWDVCSVLHFGKLPEELLTRLKSKDEYQGARYEIAIAGVFSRLNFEVAWTDKSKENKRCEFVATHRENGYSIAVEAKSKHRPGVIHQPGEEEDTPSMMKRIFREALEQNPKDTPFAVFIDVNLPPTPHVTHVAKTWVQEAKKIVENRLKGLNPGDYPLSAAFFTNFSYHYQSEREAEQAESMSIIIPHPKFPPPDERLFNMIHGALTHYGFVPPIDIEEELNSSEKNSD